MLGLKRVHSLASLPRSHLNQINGDFGTAPKVATKPNHGAAHFAKNVEQAVEIAGVLQLHKGKLSISDFRALATKIGGVFGTRCTFQDGKYTATGGVLNIINGVCSLIHNQCGYTE